MSDLKIDTVPEKSCNNPHMRRRIGLIATALVIATIPSAFAMGSGNPYVDAQTGLQYGVYEPTNTLGLPFTSINLTSCKMGDDDAIVANYAKGAKKIIVTERMTTTACSTKQLGLGKLTSVVHVKVTPAKIFKPVAIDIYGVGFTAAQLAPVTQSLLPADRMTLGIASGGSVLPPIIIKPQNNFAATVRLSNVVVFVVTDPSTWSAKVANPSIATFVPGGNRGTYVTNPGMQPLSVGATKVQLFDAGKYISTVTITVTK